MSILVVHHLDKVRKGSILYNKNTFGYYIFRKKHIIEGRLKGVQNCLENQYELDALSSLERQLSREYNEILMQEQLLWFQNYREKWVCHGDMNTKSFHSLMITRR